MDKYKILNSSTTSYFLIIVHLIANISYYNAYDWIVEWNAIISINNGISLYEVQNFYQNGIEYYYPAHFPVFFYTFAFIASLSRSSQVVARIVLWICVIILTYFTLELSNIDNKEDKIRYLNYFLANPILIGIGIYGVFDQFTYMLVMLGLYLVHKEKLYPFIGGLILGLAIMSKLYPILVWGVIGISLLKENKINKALQIGIGTFISVFAIGLYFIKENGDVFIDRAILYQSRRYTEPTSIWNFLIPRLQTEKNHEWIFFQLSIYILVFFLLLYFTSFSDKISIYMSISLCLSVYIMVSKFIYPHYAFWVIASAFPSLYKIQNESGHKLVRIWILSILFAALSNFSYWVFIYEYNLLPYIWAFIFSVFHTLFMLINITITIIILKRNKQSREN